jgi:hypothetical protein
LQVQGQPGLHSETVSKDNWAKKECIMSACSSLQRCPWCTGWNRETRRTLCSVWSNFYVDNNTSILYVISLYAWNILYMIYKVPHYIWLIMYVKCIFKYQTNQQKNSIIMLKQWNYKW